MSSYHWLPPRSGDTGSDEGQTGSDDKRTRVTARSEGKRGKTAESGTEEAEGQRQG